MDTIAACITPPGRGAVAVLRLSGPQALSIAQRLCPGGPPWRPRRQSLRAFVVEGQRLDEVLAVYHPGPHSFTGEDVVELSGHGNPLLVDALLSALLGAGARLARPGEFTRRAVEHGRMGLLQAEALASLIEARSADGLALAQGALGGLTEALAVRLREGLLDLAAELEARLDSPDEDLALLSEGALIEALGALAAEARAAEASFGEVRRALHGARVALRGPVNAGKSSLLNALVGARRALVSPEAGTTRDVIEVRLILEGMELHLLDTAGLRAEAEGIEAEGIALGEALTAGVDLTLVVLPLHRPLDPASRALLAATAPTARLLVGTHADLPQQAELAVDVAVCNPTGDGLPALRDALAQRLRRGPRSHGAQAQVISARQAALLGGVAAEAERAIEALSGVAGPAVAVQALHDALLQLAELVGQDPREEVLDRLFARFCIGK